MSFLRRWVMMDNQKQEEWNIKIFPDDTGEIQAEFVVPPSNAKGFIIEVDPTSAYQGYVYDARNIVGAYKSNAYGAYINKVLTTLDRSTLFSDNDSVGKNIAMSLGGNMKLEERVSANYLYLKWIY